jgi:hypothetical protein
MWAVDCTVGNDSRIGGSRQDSPVSYENQILHHASPHSHMPMPEKGRGNAPMSRYLLVACRRLGLSGIACRAAEKVGDVQTSGHEARSRWHNQIWSHVVNCAVAVFHGQSRCALELGWASSLLLRQLLRLMEADLGPPHLANKQTRTDNASQRRNKWVCKLAFAVSVTALAGIPCYDPADQINE